MRTLRTNTVHVHVTGTARYRASTAVGLGVDIDGERIAFIAPEPEWRRIRAELDRGIRDVETFLPSWAVVHARRTP